MKILANISRFIIGSVFIFSGFVKAVDPLGSTYKFSDYFEAFGIDFLSGIALGLAIVLSTSELLIGLCLLLKIRIKLTAWVVGVYMVFFTILTLIIAITNPVTDCGCFGDALILTNWQTFYKNLIFLLPTAVVFVYRDKFIARYQNITEWIVVAGFALLGIMISVYCYNNLPLIDFRPYSVGSYIPAKMEVPEGAPMDEYETTMIYEKDGVQKEFTVENIPWQDTTWKYVDRNTVLVKKGYEPPIRDFTLVDTSGYDATYDMLYDTDYSLLIVSSKLKKSSDKGWENVMAFVDSLAEAPITTYVMTSSVQQEMDALNASLDRELGFYTCDEITLKTMVRSNPGVLLIKDGTVIGKWHYKNLPLEEFDSSNLLASCLTYERHNKEGLVVIGFLLLLVGMIIFIEFSDIH